MTDAFGVDRENISKGFAPLKGAQVQRGLNLVSRQKGTKKVGGPNKQFSALKERRNNSPFPKKW